MDIRGKLQQAPSSPGVYVMKAAGDRVIYVGKAKNLKTRLRSYFQKSASLDARKKRMVREIRDFDCIVTRNELEALVLEANFIKRSKPRYNIILRDDKNYPYLKLTINEKWPRLEVVRRIAKDRAVYFGPYVPSGSMWEILRFIRRNFPLRTCKFNLDKPFRPCVQYQIGRCLAPCGKDFRKKADEDRYREVADEAKLFLLGHKKELLSGLEDKMRTYSDNLKFERAAAIRDRLRAIERAWESQRVISPELGDMDVIGLHMEDNEASVFLLFIRNNMVIGQKDFLLKKTAGLSNSELIEGFIEQFYSKEMILPPKILLPFKAKLDTQRRWLNEKRKDKVVIADTKSRAEKEIMKMALDNACHSFIRHRELKASPAVKQALLSLKDLLKLKTVPRRIEAVDVSNLSGSEAVGAVVVWEDGVFIRDDYRLYKIKTVTGIDDFAMIEEVLIRYFKKLSDGERKLPDLILIDGGKGQLGSALNAMKQFKLPVMIAAIAKAKTGRAAMAAAQKDRIFLPREKEKRLEPFLASTHLLQKIRDEVHRSAITFHKKLRARRVLESPLEKIRGIGKKRRLLLLRHFGSLSAIKKASVDEIASLKGMNKKIAEILKSSLQGMK
ncbi:MAG TPA: excinuclease ABC subunit UvrC [Nitrospirae bacterium]|nr:UvrABC system protein C [bacterium BMS3Abin10]GBE38976.1 UvrABC system protein C [bacterium BMS3Bbin08]HDH00300.1 excinuclease ABC subunit UvrC [Nitrospirota bacterium]HDH51165.1 excinuclease ABC subunit UvrC [Nitrospirota bacterium]HDK81049.1 excinuclease ABC subunit UvrC [Nitrospirota bacterium]